MANRWGNNDRLYFLGLQNHCRWWLQPWNWKILAPWKKIYEKTRQHIKKQRQCFANKGPYSKSYGFSSSHVGCEIWTIKKAENQKNWCFWTVVLEKTLESPLDWKEINQSILKEIDSEYSLAGWYWGLSRNTLANWCEELIHWERPWCWERLKEEEKGTTENEIVGWHHQLNGHEFV